MDPSIHVPGDTGRKALNCKGKPTTCNIFTNAPTRGLSQESSLHPMPLVQFSQFLITACKISKLQETSGKADLSCINIATFWNRSLRIWKTLMHCIQVRKSCEPLELNKQRNVCRPLWKELQVFSADCGAMVNGRMNSTLSAVMVVRLCKRKSSIIEQ